MQCPPRPGPGVEGHEAEGLGLGSVDDFPHVDGHPVAHQRQLVDEADVDGAERVLEQLDHLRDARRADRNDGLDRRTVEGARELDAGRRQAADDLRHVVRLKRRIARVDALGREREKEIAPGLQACRLEQRLHHFVRRAGVGGRLQADEQSRVQVLGNRLDRRDDVGHVRVLRLAERSRHADVDGVQLLDDGKVRRRIELAAAGQRLDVGGRDVRNIGPPFGDRLDFPAVEVDTRRPEPGLGQLDGKRQSDIAQSNDARACASSFDFVQQIGSK